MFADQSFSLGACPALTCSHAHTHAAALKGSKQYDGKMRQRTLDNTAFVGPSKTSTTAPFVSSTLKTVNDKLNKVPRIFDKLDALVEGASITDLEGDDPGAAPPMEEEVNAIGDPARAALHAATEHVRQQSECFNEFCTYINPADSIKTVMQVAWIILCGKKLTWQQIIQKQGSCDFAKKIINYKPNEASAKTVQMVGNAVGSDTMAIDKIERASKAVLCLCKWCHAVNAYFNSTRVRNASASGTEGTLRADETAEKQIAESTSPGKAFEMSASENSPWEAGANSSSVDAYKAIFAKSTTKDHPTETVSVKKKDHVRRVSEIGRETRALSAFEDSWKPQHIDRLKTLQDDNDRAIEDELKVG